MGSRRLPGSVSSFQLPVPSSPDAIRAPAEGRTPALSVVEGAVRPYGPGARRDRSGTEKAPGKATHPIQSPE